MPDPMNINSQPQISGHIGIQTGYIKNISKENIPTTQVRGGIKIEQNGWFANAEGGFGRSYEIKGELGKEFKLSQNINFTASTGMRYIKANSSNDYIAEAFEAGDQGPKWKPNHTEIFAKADFEKKTPWGGFHGGLKVSHNKSKCAELEGITLPDIGIIKGTEYAGTNTKMLVTPFAGVYLNLDKKDNWKLALDASSNESALKLSLNF